MRILLPAICTQYEARKTAFSLTTYTTLTHPKDRGQVTSMHRGAEKGSFWILMVAKGMKKTRGAVLLRPSSIFLPHPPSPT
jgi:hypothetical protein